MLAQLGSHPLTQTKISETPDAFRLVASMFRGLVESLGIRETDRGEAEDFLQSTLLLTWKLCDDPAHRFWVVANRLRRSGRCRPRRHRNVLRDSSSPRRRHRRSSRRHRRRRR